ncbi:MAG: hypothetical protein QOF98_1863, partial [Streptomyces sp.]|nr:hypothetical protein [Streptomyces sp.]
MAQRKGAEQGGLPDGLLVGFIGFLLGVTLLVWTATGIAGLFSHGAWPAEVHFTRTPRAMRSLISDPHSVAAAWPQAAPAELPGSGLFWGVFIGQLMVLLVLTVWVLNVVARLRDPGAQQRRAAAAQAAREAKAQAASEADLEAEPADPPGYGSPRLPGPRRDRTPQSRDDTLDAWFRTVPRAAPFTSGASGNGDGDGNDLTTPLPAVDAGTGPVPPAVPVGAELTAARPAPAIGLLADGEVTRTYVLFAGLGADKGKRITQPAVLAAAGPVVVTTADPDTYHQTVGNRAKLGPVHVYDPQHLLDVPGRLRWAPHG